MIRNKRRLVSFRTVLRLSALLLTVFMVGSVPLTASAADPFVGNIRAIEKESPVLRVRILRGGKIDGPVAATGDAVFQGDTIRTDEGVRIQVDLSDGSNIFIGPGSTVQMKNFMVNPSLGKRQMTVKALQGTIRFLVAKLFKNKALGSETPWKDSGVTVETHSAIAGVKGTDFVVTIGAEDVEIAVFEGVVSVKNAAASVMGEIMLASNQISRVMRGASPAAPRVLTPQMRDRLIHNTTPAKVLAPAAKAGAGRKKDKTKGDLGIAKDLAQGIPLKDIVNEAVKTGMSIQLVVAEALAAGVDPAYVVFTAISEGYDAQTVVAAALKAGAPLDAVVNAAIVGGADNKAIYVGGAEAGAPPDAMANEISLAGAPGSPVFGFTAPPAEPGFSTPPPPAAVGGGAPPSTQPASPYKP
jgi:hypothetical protein